MTAASQLHQRALASFTLPLPKAPDRWLSHDQFRPRPLECTAAGEGEGLSGLRGATMDLSCTRALLAPYSSNAGGHCDDPASAVFLEVACRVDGSRDDARFWAELRQQEKGRRDRDLAGVHPSIPGEDALRSCRRRVEAAAIEAALAVFVGLFRAFGLSTGALLSTDGQLEPSCARFKGGAYVCPDGQQLPLAAADRDALGRPLQAGATRLASRCPCPEVVHKVRQATTKPGPPREPNVALLEIESPPADRVKTTGAQQLSARLSLPIDQLPPRRLTWSHLTKGPQGELWGRGPKVPADVEARVGSHSDHTAPHTKALLFGDLQPNTTNIASELGLAWPVGTSTSPATAAEGRHFPEPRAKVAVPFLPRQVDVADAGYDASAHYHGTRARGGLPILADHPRHDDRSPEALLARGYALDGTPYAPCGRRCRSNGDHDPSDSRQSVCDRPCPWPERARCPHGQQVRGSTHNMSFHEYPRLIGPIQRGTTDWQILYAARPASARTNRDDQAVSANGRLPKLRGLKACRCAGAIRTLAHWLRRAIHVVLDVTYTLGTPLPGKT